MRWRLLEGVPDEDVRRLISVARRRTFGRNEVVFHRDDLGDSLHLISSGRFGLRLLTPVGDTVTVAVRGPGESFGEMALVGPNQRRSATVIALEPAETLCVYKDDFEQLRRRYDSIDRVLLSFLVSEVRILNERLLEALYVPVEQRVLRRLTDLTEQIPADDEGRFEIPLTQEALAELAGTTRATVNRVLRDEQQRGNLELRRARTIVLNRDNIARRGRARG